MQEMINNNTEMCGCVHSKIRFFKLLFGIIDFVNKVTLQEQQAFRFVMDINSITLACDIKECAHVKIERDDNVTDGRVEDKNRKNKKG